MDSGKGSSLAGGPASSHCRMPSPEPLLPLITSLSLPSSLEPLSLRSDSPLPAGPLLPAGLRLSFLCCFCSPCSASCKAWEGSMQASSLDPGEEEEE